MCPAGLRGQHLHHRLGLIQAPQLQGCLKRGRPHVADGSLAADRVRSPSAALTRRWPGRPGDGFGERVITSPDWRMASISVSPSRRRCTKSSRRDVPLRAVRATRRAASGGSEGTQSRAGLDTLLELAQQVVRLGQSPAHDERGKQVASGKRFREAITSPTGQCQPGFALLDRVGHVPHQVELEMLLAALARSRSRRPLPYLARAAEQQSSSSARPVSDRRVPSRSVRRRARAGSLSACADLQRSVDEPGRLPVAAEELRARPARR